MNKKQTVKEEWYMPTEEKHTPEVIAYRVGELERKTTGGFAALNKKLDDYLSTFVTKVELLDLRKDLEEDVAAIKLDIKENYVSKGTYDNLKQRVSMLFWALTIVGGVLITVLTQRFVAWLLSGGLE